MLFVLRILLNYELRKESSFITFKFLWRYAFAYIDNRNIKDDCLYQGGLRLLDTGKKILERNVIFALNECFLEMHTHHPPIRF